LIGNVPGISVRKADGFILTADTIASRIQSGVVTPEIIS
jgi:hypothetical protein